MDIRITSLHYYPIKSCAGISDARMTLEDLGFAFDRRWMVVRASDGVFISQRDCSKMACIRPSIEERAGAMTVAAPGLSELRIALDEDRPTKRRLVKIWKAEGVAQDEGGEAAEWFSEAVGFPCRLVRTGQDWIRMVDGRTDGVNLPRVGFADGYAVLLASESSLGDLNSRLDSPVTIDRFRANIVIRGDELPPWAEENWTRLSIPGAGVVFRYVKPCARCAVTTLDQSTGKAAGPEPLKTLSGYRQRDNGKVIFGLNLNRESCQPPVTISVGDRIVPTAASAVD